MRESTKSELKQILKEERIKNAKLIGLLIFMGGWIDANHPESRKMYNEKIKPVILCG